MPQIGHPARQGSLSSRAQVRVGWVLSGVAILFLLLDAAIKIPPLQPVIDTMAQLGWPSDAGTARSLALIMAVAVALYAWPATGVLGAVLLTGYLGGAVATHARIGSPLLTHTLFGVYLGCLAWLGLWLRDERVRALMPWSPRMTGCDVQGGSQ